MIDCHIHYAHSLDPQRMLQVLREYPITHAVFLCIPKGGGAPVEQDAFDFQRISPVPISVFGGLSRAVWSSPAEKQRGLLLKELERLIAMGCAGIKLLEAKPDTRKRFSIPDFDGPVWADFWRAAEERQIPLVFHVNDPEEFWDVRKISEKARKYGWYYDETHAGWREQHGQILRVLERHPRLRVLFPHFFFMSGKLRELSDILDRFHGVRLDIAPGIELFENLSAQPREARRFFERHSTRVCYGSDIGAFSVFSGSDTLLSLEESRARTDMITSFIEKDGPFEIESDSIYARDGSPFTLNGLGLCGELRERVYAENISEFLNF